MFLDTLCPFGKWLSRLSGLGTLPQIERLEERTLLSAASQALVGQMYQDLLQRSADAPGLAHWSAALDEGTSPAQVALPLARSPEGRVLQVQSLYQQFLQRGADPAGLADFTQALAAGQPLEQVAAEIVASPEFYQGQGGGSDSGFLTALYQDALNRQLDASGSAAFGQALAAGTTRAQVAAVLFGSAELQQAMVQHEYQYFLHRAADAAGLASWTQALQNGARDEQIVAAIVGSAEYAQDAGVSLQQILLPGGGGAKDVLVVNTAAQPIPVTGSVGITGTANVNVANSPTVKAQQSGPWTVGISGTANVQVISSVSNPVYVRDVNNALQPFTQEFDLAVASNALTAVSSFTVPAGRRLVIENVSAEAHVPSGQHARFFVDESIGHVIPTAFQGSLGGQDALAVNAAVKFYFDPGTVFVQVVRDQSGGTGNAFVTLDGYFVTI